MSALVRAIVVVFAVCVIGLVGWKLGGGGRSAATDSARCLDSRDPACAGRVNPAAGLTKADKGARRGPGLAGRGPKETASFEVPRTDTVLGSALPRVAATSDRGTPGALALQVAVDDLTRGLPRGLARRSRPGATRPSAADDSEGSTVEYISRAGEVVFRLLSGRGGVTATDYQQGVVYELERDGRRRRDRALADPSEKPAARAARLSRWGLPGKHAQALGKSDRASALFVDLRRSGVGGEAAYGLAQQALQPMPSFAAWRAGHAAELLGLAEGTMRAYYDWLSEVPLLGRLLAGAAGESPLKMAERFAFNVSATRRFAEGAGETELRLLGRLPPGALPERIRPEDRKRTLKDLVGDPQLAAAEPLCVASLRQALDAPEEVVRDLGGLPAGYPYLVLREEDGERWSPLLLEVRTLLALAAPIRPEDPAGVGRLRALPDDAPVALTLPLKPELLGALGLSPGGGPAAARLSLYGAAGPLRERLAADGAPLQRLRDLFADAAARPPVSYFGHPPFVYGVVSTTAPQGRDAAPVVLSRSGIPRAEALHLAPDPPGLPALQALPATVPRDAPPKLRAALGELHAAGARVAASVRRHADVLGTSAAGREFLERWAPVRAELALSGLAAGCAALGRCPIKGLARPEDGRTLLVLLDQALLDLRPRALLGPLARVDAAELADRLGELLLGDDAVLGAVTPRRSFRPGTRSAAELQRIFAYVLQATGEPPEPSANDERAFLVRDLEAPAYRARLAAWEAGARLPPPEQLDTEVLELLRDRGALPAQLGELVQRFGSALQRAVPSHLAAGQATARQDRRVRLRFTWGLDAVSVVQTMDRDGHLRDVEVLLRRPGGLLTGFSYDGDGHLVTRKGGAVLPGGDRCLGCHGGRDPGAKWQEGADGVTWLTPVVAAELARTAAERRAAEMMP